MMLAAARNSGVPAVTSGASTDSTRIEAAFVGPVERKRDEPHSEPTIDATAAE